MTLAEARRAALANRRTVAKGTDPRTGGIPTFAAAVDRVIAIQRDAWRDGGKSERQWRASLRDYAGALMSKPINTIGPGDVLAVLDCDPQREGDLSAARTARSLQQGAMEIERAAALSGLLGKAV